MCSPWSPAHSQGGRACPGAFALMYGGGVGWGLSPVLCSIVTMCLFKQRNLKIYIFYYEKYCFFYKVELDFMFYMKHLPKKERRIEQEGGDCL